MLRQQFLLLLLICAAVKCNRPPSFTDDMNNLPLDEATEVGKLVYTLKGSDPEGSPVKYGIIGTNYFTVDSTTGEVRVTKPLDREVNDTLKFYVTIEDEVGSDGSFNNSSHNNVVESAISVIVLDANDNAPVFLNLPYETETDEDTEVGTTIFSGISATDPDTVGETLTVICQTSQQNPDPCQIFEIVMIGSANQSSYSGSLVLKGKLNYKDKQIYQLPLVASDGTFTTSASLEVRVRDVQNTPPVFQGSLTAVLSEDVPIGTLVLTLIAKDGDRALPREIFYELVTNPLDYFLLNSSSGELRTAKPLDKEALPDATGVIPILVRAHELVDGVPGNDSLTVTSATVTVTVKDVNDSPPKFSQSEYQVSLPENTPIGTPLPHLDMTVKDADVGQNATFSLRLDDVSGVFDVEPKIVTGSSAVSIRLANGSLDYENPNQRKFIVLVIAEELYTNPKLSSTATLTVTITDVNDNTPAFDLDTYTASVSETAAANTYVTTITAKDYDSGDFGQHGIIYQLVGNGAENFQVNNKTGDITVASCATPGITPCLDFESKPVYYFSYKATDDNGKGQSNIIALRISLLDANDSPPECPTAYRASLDEDALKFDPPLIVQAKDPDQSSTLNYEIISGNINGLFAVDSDSGLVSFAKDTGLDVTGLSSDPLLLSIKASDGIHSAICTVNITIRDVNNHSPTFLQESYQAAIAENEPIGTSVAQLNATDLDSGLNSELRYSIQKGDLGDFLINETIGLVTIGNKLDYDRRKTYNIEVVAIDLGTPSLTGTTTLTVNIINNNDKPPYFTPITQNAEVSEDAPVGTVIYTLAAVDPDIDSQEVLNYGVSEPITAIDKQGKEVNNTDEFKHFFAVNNQTGVVTVKTPLKRDICAVVRLTVLVTDTTAPTDQQGKGMLVITIVSVNAMPPIFNLPWTPDNPNFSINMLEEQPVGTIVGTFTAIDPDSSIAGYTLESDNLYFTINNATGEVKTLQRIDYEQTKILNFVVVAYDSGVPQLNSSAHVTVNVENTNDNEPTFSETRYETELLENSPVGTHIITVSAMDKDDDDFGKISFSLVGEHSNVFEINSDSGEITVKNVSVLDREANSEFTIFVLAEDNAPEGISRSATVPVHIKILDENDNKPAFLQQVYHGSVYENLAVSPPTPILQVKAKDEDYGINGTVYYKIISGNDGGEFRLDRETGILYPQISLKGHSGKFVLKVEGRDMAGDGYNFDTADISIIVQSVNQHMPVFIIPALANTTIEIPENEARADYLIMTVKATDEDIGENGRLTYHLKISNENVQSTEDFIIDQETGELRLVRFLDRQRKSKYELVLVARDQATSGAHEALKFLFIIIKDTNDHNPEFPDTSNPYKFYIRENSEESIRLGQVQAIDKDEGRYAKIYYYILKGNEDHGFVLDKSQGTLYSNKSFDREKKPEYLLYILASNDPNFIVTEAELSNITDTNVEKNNTIGKVHIYIMDENDNAPVFLKEHYYAGVDSRASINNFVTVVTAVDPDFGLNGTISYHISASNLYKLGSNHSSGSIEPSPFAIAPNGRITTGNYMAEFNQDIFILDVIAIEAAPPERQAATKVHVWIFEPDQLIRVILSRPASEVNAEQDEIIAELSNATQKRIIVDEIRYHVDATGYIRQDWSDMFFHAVEPDTQQIAPISSVLRIIDAQYDFLKDYYAGFAIENVVPAYSITRSDEFDSAMGALIALVIVLFVGAVSFFVACCCLRHWNAAGSSDIKKKDNLIKKQIIEDLNTTENPLWIEQKLKLYEEQELTMQVFSDPEGPTQTPPILSHYTQSTTRRRDSMDFSQVDNTYATINPPARGNSSGTSIDLSGDYATLSAPPRPYRNIRGHGSEREAPSLFEAAMGFQGSTFQVPETFPSEFNANQEIAQTDHATEVL